MIGLGLGVVIVLGGLLIPKDFDWDWFRNNAENFSCEHKNVMNLPEMDQGYCLDCHHFGEIFDGKFKRYDAAGDGKQYRKWKPIVDEWEAEEQKRKQGGSAK